MRKTFKKLILSSFGVLILSLVVLPILGKPAQALTNCTAPVASLSDPFVKSVWDEFMGRRTGLGLPVYTWSNNLAQSAAWMASDISVNQASSVPPTDLDSLGRDIRARATNCGYRTDAQVWETAMFMWATDPFGVISIWQGNDAFRFFQALHSSTQYLPIYTTAALGYNHDSVSGKYFWVMNLGTLPDSGSTYSQGSYYSQANYYSQGSYIVPDTTAPTVNVTSPANGSTVQGPVNIQAVSSDNISVSSTTVFVDGQLVQACSGSTCNFNWDTTQYGNGSHSIYASALDSSNNYGQSQTINVTVSNTTPTPVPGNWTFCADENGVCSFSGTKQVRYGLDPIYNFIVATNSISCNNGTFGDPYPGVFKHCDYTDVTATSSPNPTPTPAPIQSVVISNITATTTSNSATIRWTTNVPTSSFVKYGTNSNNLNLSSPVTTSSVVTLSNLSSKNTYYFTITSTSTSNNTSTSSIQSFRTKNR